MTIFGTPRVCQRTASGFGPVHSPLSTVADVSLNKVKQVQEICSKTGHPMTDLDVVSAVWFISTGPVQSSRSEDS